MERNQPPITVPSTSIKINFGFLHLIKLNTGNIRQPATVTTTKAYIRMGGPLLLLSHSTAVEELSRLQRKKLRRARLDKEGFTITTTADGITVTSDLPSQTITTVQAFFPLYLAFN